MENEKYLKLMKENGIDVERTIARLANNEALFIKFFKKFFEETSLDELRKNIEDKQYEEAANSTHTFKGVTGNLGILAMYELLSKMLSDMRNEKYDELESDFETLDKEFNRLKALAL